MIFYQKYTANLRRNNEYRYEFAFSNDQAFLEGSDVKIFEVTK